MHLVSAAEKEKQEANISQTAANHVCDEAAIALRLYSVPIHADRWVAKRETTCEYTGLVDGFSFNQPDAVYPLHVKQQA